MVAQQLSSLLLFESHIHRTAKARLGQLIVCCFILCLKAYALQARS